MQRLCQDLVAVGGSVLAALFGGSIRHRTGHGIGGRFHLGLGRRLAPLHLRGRRRTQKQRRRNSQRHQHARHGEYHRIAEVVRQENAREGPDGAAERDRQHEVSDALALALRGHHARDHRGDGGGAHAVGEPVGEAHADKGAHRLVQQVQRRERHLRDASGNEQGHAPKALHHRRGGKAREQRAHDEGAGAEGGHGGRRLVHRECIGGHDHHEHEVVAGNKEVQEGAGDEVPRPKGRRCGPFATRRGDDLGSRRDH